MIVFCDEGDGKRVQLVGSPERAEPMSVVSAGVHEYHNSSSSTRYPDNSPVT